MKWINFHLRFYLCSYINKRRTLQPLLPKLHHTVYTTAPGRALEHRILSLHDELDPIEPSDYQFEDMSIPRCFEPRLKHRGRRVVQLEQVTVCPGQWKCLGGGLRVVRCRCGKSRVIEYWKLIAVIQVRKRNSSRYGWPCRYIRERQQHAIMMPMAEKVKFSVLRRTFWCSSILVRGILCALTICTNKTNNLLISI